MPKKKLLYLVFQRKAFPKARYKELEKRTLQQHPHVIYSTVPAATDEPVPVPVSKSRTTQWHNANTIFVIDNFSSSDHVHQKRTQIRYVSTGNHNVPLMVFNIRETGTNPELWLNYSGNADNIGEPHRDDFLITVLEENKPILFYINGFFDRGQQHQKQRVYLEQVYYIEFAGIKEVEASSDFRQQHKRVLRLQEATTITLRKLFY